MSAPDLPTARFYVEQRDSGLVLRARLRDRARLLHAGLWGLRLQVVGLAIAPLVVAPDPSTAHTPSPFMLLFTLSWLGIFLGGLMWEIRYGAYTGPAHRFVERSFAILSGVAGSAGYRDGAVALQVDGREVRGTGARVVVIHYIPRPRPGSQAEVMDRFVVCVAVSGAVIRLETFRTEPAARALAESLATLLGAAYDPVALPGESPLPPGWRIQLAAGLMVVPFTAAIVTGMIVLSRGSDLGWTALALSVLLVEGLSSRLVLRPLARREAEARAATILSGFESHG